MKRFTIMTAISILGVATLLQSCGIKPSELNFDDSNLDRRIASTAEDYDIVTVMSNRAYVESVLGQAFGVMVPSNYQTTASSGMSATLEAGIYRIKEFGGACDRYAPSELPTSGSPVMEFPREACFTGIGASQQANSNPQRYSYTTKLCENFVANSTQFSTAMTKVFPGWSTSQPSPDAESITQVYRVFFPTETPSDELTAYLANSSAPSKDEAWRRIFLTFCISPEWQAL